jgi:protein-arginine kinase
MHIFAPDDNHLKIQVTDYHSNTFEAVKSVMQLDDMVSSWIIIMDF